MVPCDSEQHSPKGSAMGVNSEIKKLGQEGHHWTVLGGGYKLVIPHFEKVTNRTTNMLSYYTFTQWCNWAKKGVNDVQEKT